MKVKQQKLYACREMFRTGAIIDKISLWATGFVCRTEALEKQLLMDIFSHYKAITAKNQLSKLCQKKAQWPQYSWLRYTEAANFASETGFQA